MKVSKSERTSHVIRLQMGDVAFGAAESSHVDVEQGYTLTVTDSNVINLVGTSPTGVFYAAVTLANLLDNETNSVPVVNIIDAPRFPYRGFMLDVARNFQPVKEILKLLDEMAMYKLNKFHFHLADDEGWRLDIKDLPELTRVCMVAILNC